MGDLLLDKLDAVLYPGFQDRGHFLPRDDLKSIAQVIRVLTSDSWTEEDLDLFDASWRDAMRSDLIGDEFEGSKHRIQNAVDTARRKILLDGATLKQGFLW